MTKLLMCSTEKDTVTAADLCQEKINEKKKRLVCFYVALYPGETIIKQHTGFKEMEFYSPSNIIYVVFVTYNRRHLGFCVNKKKSFFVYSRFSAT